MVTDIFDVLTILSDVFINILSENDLNALRCVSRKGWLQIGKRYTNKIRQQKKQKRQRYNNTVSFIVKEAMETLNVPKWIERLREIDALCTNCLFIKGIDCIDGMCEDCIVCETCETIIDATSEHIYIMTHIQTQETSTICADCRYSGCWYKWLDDNDEEGCLINNCQHL